MNEPTPQILWIVGLYLAERSWELCGVFTTEDEAKKQCSTEYHFIGPIELGKLIIVTDNWPNAYYPLTK